MWFLTVILSPFDSILSPSETHNKPSVNLNKHFRYHLDYWWLFYYTDKIWNFKQVWYFSMTFFHISADYQRCPSSVLVQILSRVSFFLVQTHIWISSGPDQIQIQWLRRKTVRLWLNLHYRLGQITQNETGRTDLSKKSNGGFATDATLYFPKVFERRIAQLFVF